MGAKSLPGLLLVLSALLISVGCATTKNAANSADRQMDHSHRHFKHSIRREATFVDDKLHKVAHEGRRAVGAEKDERRN